MNELELVTACCYKLIGVANETNAETAEFKFEDVTFKDEHIGDWKVTITRM